MSFGTTAKKNAIFQFYLVQFKEYGKQVDELNKLNFNST